MSGQPYSALMVLKITPIQLRLAMSNVEERYTDAHTPLAERHGAEYDFHDDFVA